MEQYLLLLTVALGVTWLAGAYLIWWNLRRQERLIGDLYQLTARLLHQSVREPAVPLFRRQPGCIGRRESADRF